MHILALLLFACTPAKVTGPTAEDSGADSSADSGDDSGSDSGGDSDTGGDTDSGGDTDPGEGVVLGGTATVAANPYNPMSALVTVTLDHDATVVVNYGAGEPDHSTPAVSVTANEATEIVVLGLRAGMDFKLRAEASLGSATWESDPLSLHTDALPSGWPTCTPTFTADESEYSPDEVFCTNGSKPDGTYMYMCVNRWGEPLLSIQTRDNDSLMSMRPLRTGGWASTSFTASKVLLFNGEGKQIGQYTPSWFAGKTRFTHDNIDSHEMYEIPSGTWAGALVFFTNTTEYFSDGSYKLGNGLIVLDPDTEEVLYDYSFNGVSGDGVAMDDKMPYSRAGYGDYAEDWTHANAILFNTDADGRAYFLVSLKSQDWIFKLYPDTDELAWALGWDGDFTLVDDIDSPAPIVQSNLDWAYHQHGMVFIDRDGPRNSLMMFDNGYPRHDDRNYRWDLYYSRIVQIRYDEDTMLADLQFSYGEPDSGSYGTMFSSTCGNANLLPGDAAAYGLAGESDTITEVGYPGGEPRWKMTCESAEWCSLRAQYYPSLYDLVWDDR